jgi:hypothetical protein
MGSSSFPGRVAHHRQRRDRGRRGYAVIGATADPVLNGGAPVDYAYGVGAITLANDDDDLTLQVGAPAHRAR